MNLGHLLNLSHILLLDGLDGLHGLHGLHGAHFGQTCHFMLKFFKLLRELTNFLERIFHLVYALEILVLTFFHCPAQLSLHYFLSFRHVLIQLVQLLLRRLHDFGDVLGDVWAVVLSAHPRKLLHLLRVEVVRRVHHTRVFLIPEQRACIVDLILDLDFQIFLHFVYAFLREGVNRHEVVKLFARLAVTLSDHLAEIGLLV